MAPETGRRLIGGLVVANLALLLAVVTLLVRRPTPEPMHPSVLSAERIDIVDSTGRPVLVLANGPRLPGATFAGREYPPSFTDRGRVAGMLFYNSEGDEVGGLIYDGVGTDSGHASLGHLSFDQWKQSQVIAITYSDHDGSRLAALRVWDRPTVALEEQFAIAEQFLAATGATRDSLRTAMTAARERVAGTERLFVGSQDRAATVALRDTLGRPRAVLTVDSTGSARLTFLDEGGHAVAIYPPQ